MGEDLTEVRGVGPVTAKRLAEAGILAISDLATLSDKKLVKLTGFPLTRALSIRQSAAELLADRSRLATPAASPVALAESGDMGSGKKGKKKEKAKSRKKDKKSKKGKKSKKSRK